jgi:hypothetical protein
MLVLWFKKFDIGIRENEADLSGGPNVAKERKHKRNTSKTTKITQR